MIFLELCQLCGLCNGLVKAAKLVDKLDFQCVLSKPYAPLGYFLNVLNLHLATLRNALAEQVVAAVYIFIKVVHLLLVERTCRSSESAVPVCLHLVEFHSELLRKQFAHVGEHSEYSNAAGKRRRLGHNPVCAAADVVSSRCGHASH